MCLYGWSSDSAHNYACYTGNALDLVTEALRCGTPCPATLRHYLHTHAFILEWIELYLSLPSQLKLVLIY